MKTKSLIRRSVISVLIAQLLCAAVLCLAALLHEYHSRFRAFDTRLQGRSDSLLGAVQDAEDPEDNVTIDPVELKLPDEDTYAVYNSGGRLLGSSGLAPQELIARTRDGFRTAQIGGKHYRILQREALRIIDRAEYGGVGLRRPVTIVYASPEAPVWHEIFEAASFYLVAILFASGGVVLLVNTLLRRTLSPLTDLVDATAGLTAPALAFAPPESALQLQELRPLAQVLNASIERLRTFFARERQFFGDAAHELKTATAVIRSSAQLMLLRRRTEEEYSSGLERIVDDTERLEALISQMLQLARATETEVRTRHEIIDLGKAAQEIAQMLEPIAQQKSLIIAKDVAKPAPVRMAKQAAETLISNLLLNALQYSNPGEMVEIVVAHDAAGCVRLEVSDCGCGIGVEALPHIFDRFYREDDSRSRETGGTGLGLAISKSIVDAVQGTISVDSVKGEGTTVKVLFTAA